MTPKISIIIPVYNVEKYLRVCLTSIINQTYNNLEIICINDGSTDNSADILEEFAIKDSRIKIVHQENKGQSSARNVGLDIADGDYIGFIDSDDSVHPQFIEILLKLIEKSDADMAECRIIKCNTSQLSKQQTDYSKIKSRILKEPLKSMLSHQHFRIRFMVCPCLYKANLIKNYKFQEGIYFEDYPWKICLMSKKPKVAVTNVKLYNYTYNPTSTTKSKFTVKKVHDYGIGLQSTLEYFKSNDYNISFLQQRLIPTIFETQWQLIKNEKYPEELVRAFAEQILWAKENNLLSLRYNNWWRMLIYHKIIRTYLS